MKKISICLLMFCFGSVAFAGVLPGGIKGSVELAYEDDRLDADSSLGKTKLTLKKPITIRDLSVTPYVYYEDESNDGFFSAANRKETETAIGVDVIALQNDSAKITLSTIWEYEDNATGDDDALLILKMKADF
ncbi:MAG: hypothetical protein ABH823_05180 [bacterium]